MTEQKGGAVLESFSGRSVGAFSLGGNGVAVFLKNSNRIGSILKVYTSGGKVHSAPLIEADVRALSRYGDAIFYRTDTEIGRWDLKTGKIDRISCPVYGGEFLAVSDDRALICQSGAATYYRFGK